jgi:ketosteroid isomerase-like protein
LITIAIQFVTNQHGGTRVIDNPTARSFAKAWADSWNAHDLDRVLEHFSEDVVFSSPAAVRLIADSDGEIRGKSSLRSYWTEGLRRIPDLRFEVLGVYVGLNVVVINYQNQAGGLVNEILTFEGDLVVRGHAAYLSQELDLGEEP